MINEMNRANAKKIRTILENELPELLAKHGLEFELGNASFDSDSIHFKGFRLKLEGGLSQDAKALESELSFRKQTNQTLLCTDKIADVNGKKAQLVGFRPKARKNPFIIREVSSNSEYVITEMHAELLFAAS
jgi:hypothetical protein